MSKNVHGTAGPDWDRLYEIALAQEGHFTIAQATEAGYYPQLLAKYLKNGKIIRIRRGIYRLAHFPAGEQEDLIVVWLWTERAGVFSHETALALHGLSDVLPARVHVSLPSSWSKRRLRIPRGVMLHFADVAESDRSWVGAIRVTNVNRTLVDIVHARVSPDLVCDAFEEAADRGLVDRNALPSVVSYLKQFFSISHSRSGPRFSSSSGRSSRPE
ncbi:MAG TPA: type IV toxin-antitoxin system AbiEi family antitoxin domain-containing protein [Myxococcota bacterium]|nr:type IV toxin-antitoxin system AbiEi family antitoxin domain-containing protein [Myxococcota bacterium]